MEDDGLPEPMRVERPPGSARTPDATLLALIALATPSAAYAQDLSALVVLAAPPLLLAPLLAAALRRRWLRQAVPSARSGSRLLAWGLLELVLWLVIVWCGALVYFRESGLALLGLVGTLAAIVVLARQMVAGHGTALTWLGLAAVFPVTWLVSQLVIHGVLLVWPGG